MEMLKYNIKTFCDYILMLYWYRDTDEVENFIRDSETNKLISRRNISDSS